MYSLRKINSHKMAKIKIEGHPSMVIVLSDSCPGEVILGGYDGGYPRLAYRSRPNLLGGNPSKEDKKNGPKDVIIRELNEELEKGENFDWKGRPVSWASEKDILKIRESIINNLKPYSDFLYQAKPLEGAIKENITAIYSVFVSLIPKEIVELIRMYFINGKKMVTEGFLGVYSLNSLAMAGEYSTANATGNILSEYFKILIPSPEEIKITKLEKPIRENYSDYFIDYEYTDSAWSRE